MAILSDTFPSPSLDSNRWSSTVAGSGAIAVGSPSDGVYISSIDDDGDSAIIDSDGKLQVAAGQTFDVRIEYNDLDTDPDQNLYAFLSWRSALKSGGQPVYGIDLVVMRDTGGNYYFQRRTLSSGSPTIWTNIIADPTSGANGKLRITRSGYTYSLYYFDSTLTLPDWVFLDTITLGSNGGGFFAFGYFAVNPASPSFPLIIGT